MKTLAFLEKSYEAQLVSIWEIKRFRSQWEEGRVFFSLVGLHPMHARTGGKHKQPTFYYKNRRKLPLGAKLTGGGGEGAVHELAKLHIARKQEIEIRVREIAGKAPAVLVLPFDSIDMEVARNINGTTYVIDLLGQLRVDSPLIERWGKEIAIEIRDQHPVPFRKRKDLQENLTTLEITLPKDMHLTHDQESDRSLIEGRRRRIGGLFAKPVWANIISIGVTTSNSVNARPAPTSPNNVLTQR